MVGLRSPCGCQAGFLNPTAAVCCYAFRPHMNQPISLRLFDEPERKKEDIWVSPGAVILAGYAREQMDTLFADLRAVEAISPFRHMVTRQGFEIHVETTGCGPLSWVSDRSGYRYDHIDP